jgi:hypothetical protein
MIHVTLRHWFEDLSFTYLINIMFISSIILTYTVVMVVSNWVQMLLNEDVVLTLVNT